MGKWLQSYIQRETRFDLNQNYLPSSCGCYPFALVVELYRSRKRIYCFTPPSEMPATNARWVKKNRMIIGAATAKEAAIKYAQLTSNELRKKLRPSMRV